MSTSTVLVSVTESDEQFLSNLYALTRAAELSIVPWSEEQKRAFLQMQFEAQNRYYRERYPNASFEIIKINGCPVGRFYHAELADEIRIIDLLFAPEHFDKNHFVELVEKMLRKGEQIKKPVRIFLENGDPVTEIFIRLGFRKIDEHGIYFLWQREPAA